MKDCVSIEVAQRLQKAGYKSECELYWQPYWGSPNPPTREAAIMYKLIPFSKVETRPDIEQTMPAIPAPTATQLMEEFPWLDGSGWFQIVKLKDEYKCSFMVSSSYCPYFQKSKTLPDALGLMREYLLLNGLIAK